MNESPQPPANPPEGSPSVDPRFPQGHILGRINEEHQRKGRESHDRMMLHSFMEREWEYLMGMREAHDRAMLYAAFSKELDGSLLENEQTLELESFKPGDLSMALPGYFADIANHSDFPENLTAYTAEDFSKHRLFKLKGLDAGFAIKCDGDIRWLHNDTRTTRGLATPLLQKAIEEGGTKLDHFDGRLAIKNLFPNIYRKELWDDEFAPKGWKYAPIRMEDSIYALEHAQQRESPDERMSQLRENYAKGKPCIVYREIEK